MYYKDLIGEVMLGNSFFWRQALHPVVVPTGESILGVYHEAYLTTLRALGNLISQTTQQKLSNLPRAFRGQARDGAQVGLSPGKARLFPLQKPVSNLRESPEWIWGFQKAVIFFSLALSLIEQLVHTSYMPSPAKETGDWETDRVIPLQKTLRFGNRCENITTRQC